MNGFLLEEPIDSANGDLRCLISEAFELGQVMSSS
jgi:hypothetical protein